MTTLRFLGTLLLAAAALACAGSPGPGPRKPTVILVSIDGFRWDYLDRGITPNLGRLATTGVRAEAMVPVFPTKTFPNHYSIVTGRYPGHHGIVGNTFRAPDLGTRYTMHDRALVRDGRFYLAEPIWVTAERQGQRTAPFYWPGSEAAIGGVRPAYNLAYNPVLPDADRVSRVLGWLDMPARRRPAFITMYLSGVDAAGHRYGPDAPETRSAIIHADSVVGSLIAGLEKRAIGDSVNLIVVSDHGMAATSPSRTISLGRYLPREWLDVDNLSPALMAWPRAGSKTRYMSDSARRRTSRCIGGPSCRNDFTWRGAHACRRSSRSPMRDGRSGGTARGGTPTVTTGTTTPSRTCGPSSSPTARHSVAGWWSRRSGTFTSIR